MLSYTRKDGQPVFLPTDSGLFPRYKAAIFYPYIIIFLSQNLFCPPFYPDGGQTPFLWAGGSRRRRVSEVGTANRTKSSNEQEKNGRNGTHCRENGSRVANYSETEDNLPIIGEEKSEKISAGSERTPPKRRTTGNWGCGRRFGEKTAGGEKTEAGGEMTD